LQKQDAQTRQFITRLEKAATGRAARGLGGAAASWYNTLMETSYTPLPHELRSILTSCGDEPLHLIDNVTNKVYVLVEDPSPPPMHDDYIRKLLAEADEDIARGDVDLLDMEEIKAEARRIYEQRRASQ
jgi:hypothetical protein